MASLKTEEENGEEKKKEDGNGDAKWEDCNFIK